MNTTVRNVIVFMLGAGAGCAVSALYFKKKYQKELYETREAYNNMTRCFFDKPDIVELAKKYNTAPVAKTYDPPRPIESEDSDTDEENDISPDLYGVNPIDDPFYTTTTDSKNIDDYTKPYVITPEEFGDYPSFSRIDLTLYSDGVLCEDLEPVEDVESKVGIDNLNQIGQYEDDAVYIRNERLRSDFCVLTNESRYNDIIRGRSDYPKE